MGRSPLKIAMLVRARAMARIGLGLADTLVGFMVVTSTVMLLQLVNGQFRPGTSLAISLLVCGALGLFLVRRIVMPAEPRILRAVALAAFVAMVLRLDPFLHVLGGQDQGVYVAMSSYFERTHGLRLTDEVRERLRGPEKAEYDRLNNRYDGKNAEVPGRSEGEHQPGIFIEDLSRSAYSFQFYPLHPLWMAMAGKLLGSENRVYALVLFSVLNILMLSLLAFELAGRRLWAAFLTAALVAFNPLHVFLSRFPVTENVVLFFSASAFYQLLRYFKSAESGRSETWRLVLSGGAWACLFLTHIGGFLYLPLVFVAVALGTASAHAPTRMQHLLGYGLGVLAAYFLSVAHGLTWSFPYNYGIYRALFGAEKGRLFIAHWPAIGVFLAIALCALVYGTWRIRDSLRSKWSGWRLDRVLVVVFLALILASAGRAGVEAYRLGFTDAYAQAGSNQRAARSSSLHSFAAAGENRARIVARFSNSGIAGITHTSFVALALYISPFILLFVFVMLASHVRGIGIYELFLALIVTQFIVLRTGMVPLTPYYYYGRYLGAELVPYLLLLASLWLCRLWDAPSALARRTARTVFGLTLAWEAIAAVPQYGGGEMHRTDEAMRPWVERIGGDDLLLLAGGASVDLRTALGYYYGKPTAVVDAARLPELLPQYDRDWRNVYVLSNAGTLPGVVPIEEVSIVRNTYARGPALDVLPAGSLKHESRYFLYAYRPEQIRLKDGTVIHFGRGGDAGPYLGSGWSDPEESMRWTDGLMAELMFPFAEGSAVRSVQFDVHSYTCSDVIIRVNGEHRTRWAFSPCAGYSTQRVALTEADLKSGRVSLSFDMPGALSPHEKDPRLPDRRKLGISVRTAIVGSGAMEARTAASSVGSASSADNRADQMMKGLSAGIDFSRTELPPFIVKMDGISVAEPWGRWTDGPVARIRLAAPLPNRFALELVVPHVFGPNRNLPFRLRIGDVERTFNVSKDNESFRFLFSTRSPSDTIELHIPAPMSPAELGKAPDPRRLGIRLKQMRIVVDP